MFAYLLLLFCFSIHWWISKQGYEKLCIYNNKNVLKLLNELANSFRMCSYWTAEMVIARCFCKTESNEKLTMKCAFIFTQQITSIFQSKIKLFLLLSVTRVLFVDFWKFFLLFVIFKLLTLTLSNFSATWFIVQKFHEVVLFSI